MSRPLLGAHVSVAGGYENGIVNAEKLGAECIQIFGASPQQWSAKVPDKAVCETFKKARAGSAVKSVYLHGPYLVNLASTDPVQIKKSITGLATHLKIAEALGAQGLIFHVGSGKDLLSKAEAVKKASLAMKEVLKLAPGDAFLVMENSASEKKVGATPEELGEMMRLVKNPRAKVCVDTAHAFEAGLIDEYVPVKIKKFLDRWDSAVGLKNIVALHANDSKSEAGSNFDRHENIGKGHIGLAGFKNLAKEARLAHTSWFLEVPGYEGLGPDKKNMDALKACFVR